MGRASSDQSLVDFLNEAQFNIGKFRLWGGIDMPVPGKFFKFRPDPQGCVVGRSFLDHKNVLIAEAGHFQGWWKRGLSICDIHSFLVCLHRAQNRIAIFG